MSVGAAGLLLAGSALVFATLLLPHGAHLAEWGVAVPALLALAMAAALLLARGRTPGWIFHVVLAVGAVLVGVCVYYGGESASAYRSMYVWVAVYAVYFFPLRAAVAHIVFALAVYALVLSETHAALKEVSWLVTVITISVAGAFVGLLTTALRRVSAELAERRVREEREHRALEINDNIVQGLAVAKYALETGQLEAGTDAIDNTLDKARAIMSDQLGRRVDETGVRPGDLVREGTSG
jgi:signal transduction histidine kinase